MADYGTRQTDEAVKRAERRLRGVYREAQEDIGEKLQAWQEAHKAREAKYRKMVADGKMSQDDFDAWMRGQVFQGKQWAARKKEIDQVLLNADKAAAKIVNEGKVGVFADNANYIGYGLEHDLRIDSGFTLYDESTVARLIKDDPQILPKAAPGVVKDKAFPYYNKLMSSAITQGIVQGETIDQIAKRIMDKTGENSYKSAVRNARTAYTGAQNAGRIEGLHQAQRLGIEVKKKWLATLDDRTRDTHRDLDGQIRNVDEPFSVDGDEIDFPGDPKAKPALVWNCRCTLIYEYPEYPSSMDRLDNITREKIGDMTYREWEQWKASLDKEEQNNNIEVTIEPIINNNEFKLIGGENDSFAGRLASEKLSPYSYELDYFEYAEQMQAWDGDRTQWIESVHPGTVIDMQTERTFDGEPHCSFAPIDNAVARLYEQVPLTADHSNLVLCDYDNARFHLPNGEDDRRLTVDAIAQVFENEGQTVIAFRRDWMNHSLKESLEERQRMIDEGQVLPMVFPVASPEGVVMHEWGHTVHSHFLNAMCYDDPDAQELWNWYKTLSKEDITTGLSEYAAVNFGEFTAECFAEMQTSNPRPLARQCWQYMSGLIGRGY